MLILLHILLERQHLLLQTIPQSGQRITNVIRQLLIQCLLQIRRAHLIGHMTIRRVTQEKLPLGRHRQGDVLFALDVLLRAIHHANVSASQREQFILENVFGVGALVHEIELRDDTNRACSLRIDLFGELERIGVGQIRVGWRHSENETRFLFDELVNHRFDLRFDVDGLIADGNFGEAWQVDEGEIQDCIELMMFSRLT